VRDLSLLVAIVIFAVILVVLVLGFIAHRRDQHIQDAAVDVWRSIVARFRR